MENILKMTRGVIRQMDSFFDGVENGLMLFREAVNDYADNRFDDFARRLKMIEEKESEADHLQRRIENDFLVHSLLPQVAGDVLRLLDKTDDLIDQSKYVLQQFDVERPQIHDKLKDGLKRLNEVSNAATVEAIAAVRVFFSSQVEAKDHINKIYFYERESDRAANELRRVIFQQIDDIDLAHKEQLRYFTRHIEQLSDAAEVVADILSLLSIKVML
ncbi:MAG: DUF47 family protein [Salinivirgaceae bacterium]|nr:DUF47 family protein [Salinivirgaceae bacterium]